MMQTLEQEMSSYVIWYIMWTHHTSHAYIIQTARITAYMSYIACMHCAYITHTSYIHAPHITPYIHCTSIHHIIYHTYIIHHMCATHIHHTHAMHHTIYASCIACLHHTNIMHHSMHMSCITCIQHTSMHTSYITSHIMHVSIKHTSCVHHTCIIYHICHTSYMHHTSHACITHHLIHTSYIYHASHHTSWIISYITYHCQGMASNIRGTNIKLIYVLTCLAGFLFLFEFVFHLLLSQLTPSLFLYSRSCSFLHCLMSLKHIVVTFYIHMWGWKTPPALACVKLFWLFAQRGVLSLKSFATELDRQAPALWPLCSLMCLPRMVVLQKPHAYFLGSLGSLLESGFWGRLCQVTYLHHHLSPRATSPAPFPLYFLSLTPLTPSNSRCILLVHLCIVGLSSLSRHLAHRKHWINIC